MISGGDAVAREASAPPMPAEWSTTMCASRYSVGIIGLDIGSLHIEGYRRQGVRVEAICVFAAYESARTNRVVAALRPPGSGFWDDDRGTQSLFG